VLLLLNLPLVPLFAQLLRVPTWILFPVIFGLSIIGAYSVSERIFDVELLAAFGLLGFLMAKTGFPSAPLILGFVLGDAMERALRQSLMMSQGDLTTFFQRPISLVLLIAAVVILLLPLVSWFNRARVRAISEGA
ncbi:MAG: tripartite tricarboxylate transporter permease, partial [Chelatococcus sp.]